MPRCAGIVAAVRRGRPGRRWSPCRAPRRAGRRRCGGILAIDRFRMRQELLYADVVAAGGGVQKVRENVRSKLGLGVGGVREL